MAKSRRCTGLSFLRSSLCTLAVVATLAVIGALLAACGDLVSTVKTEPSPTTAANVPPTAETATLSNEIELATPPASVAPATIALAPAPAEVSTREMRVVTSQRLIFEPRNINVNPGETIFFLIENPSTVFHTFTIAISTGKDEILVDISVAPVAVETATVTFPDVPATLYLFCRPHEATGMIGQVHVGDEPEKATAQSAAGAGTPSVPTAAPVPPPSPTPAGETMADRVEAVV